MNEDSAKYGNEMKREMMNAEGKYRSASMVRLSMDDPVNDRLEKGTVMLIEGPCEDGISHTVMDRDQGDFVDIECELLETFEADSWMTKEEIKDWGVEQAKKTERWG